MVAHRTSPTNMGFALLANLSAYDFGYISAGQFIERTANALRTMEALERHRGHFYNWYDTQSLKPLPPLYISSVDSGNLAGHLLTLRQGLLALPDDNILGARLFDGLSDTLRVLVDVAGGSAPAQLAQLQKDLDLAADSQPATLAAARLCLERLAALAADVAAARHRCCSTAVRRPRDPGWWAHSFVRQCRDALDEIMFLAPWTPLLSSQNRLQDFHGIDGVPTLRQLSNLEVDLLPEIEHRLALKVTPEEKAWLDELRPLIMEASHRAGARIAAIEGLALQSNELARMEYDFLFDKARHLLAIGYNVGEHRQDSSYYDLLASEARFSSFVAIAQGELPQDSWFALGRLLTTTGGEPILLSWSGSMFEYLMPLLVMPTYENTLLDQTCKAAVASQIEYGRKCGVPWGISECGYNAIDVHLNYQYRAFGVPGLGLKRGLAEDLVIAPYASALALMVAMRFPGDAAGHGRRQGGVRTTAGRYEPTLRACFRSGRGGKISQKQPPVSGQPGDGRAGAHRQLFKDLRRSHERQLPRLTAWQYSARGLFHLRKAEYAQGADCCRKCLDYVGPEGPDSPRPTAARLILAMCEFNQAQTDAALAHFNAADRIVREQFKAGVPQGDGSSSFWVGWVDALILRNEAAGLLGQKPPRLL